MTDAAAIVAAVCETLWLQRESLDDLLFKLVEEQLVVQNGATRWLARANDEVRAAMQRMQRGEVLRSAHVEGLAMAMGLPVDASLLEIAAGCDEPWRTMLLEHRTALRELIFEVQGVARENYRLLGARAATASPTLSRRDASDILAYQHACSAAASVLTTVDSMLDTLINHTGLVTRD